MTNPVYSSTFPAYYNRTIARNSAFMLFCCDRDGSPQAFRIDLKNGQTRQLSATPDLDGTSLTLTPDNRSFCYFAGRSHPQVLIDLFSPATAANFRPHGDSRIAGVNAKLYDFEVDREHSENSSVTAQIDVRSIDTRIKKRDDHLRSPEFFDVEKFPNMTFKSRSVKRTGPQSGDILGDLTMHGVTKAVTLHVKLLTPINETNRTRWSVSTFKRARTQATDKRPAGSSMRRWWPIQVSPGTTASRSFPSARAKP